MENAAKALIIAGGVLFAIIILSLVVYMSTTTTRMAKAQDDKKAEEEIFAFNKEYEAYNKTRMYGTDIITVMKKAIDYNLNVDNDQKITIELTTSNNYSTVTETTITSASGKETKTKTKTTSSLGSGSYTQDDSSIREFLEQSLNDYYDEDNSNESTKVYVYSALTSFKRSIFECTGTEYGQSGRIIKMSFEEIKNFSDI